MGLAMISAIKDFDEDRNESVNMRVGIHTGTVLCGIVGKRRFKFDVWSNDVSLANKMESTGRPGMVHISERTYAFLKDEYFVQEGEPVKGEWIREKERERPCVRLSVGKKRRRRTRRGNKSFPCVVAA